MSVTLLTGVVGSGKTCRILKLLAPFASKQEGLCIAPSENIAAELRNTLAREQGIVFGNVFLSFNMFVKGAADTEEKILTAREQSLLLYEILSKGKFNYFRSASWGVAKQAQSAISSLKRNFVSPKGLEKIIGTSSTSRERDILLLYEGYEAARKKHKAVDEADLTLMAADNISSKKTDFIGDLKFLAFDEFNYLSPGQIHLIDLIKKNYGHTDIFIGFASCEDRQALHYDYIEKTLNELKKIVTRTERIESPRRQKQPVFEYKILRSARQENFFVSERIRQILREGAAPDDIAVIGRRGDSTLNDILEELQKGGVPIHRSPSFKSFFVPVMNGAFTDDSSLDLPEKAQIREFIKILRAHLKQKHERFSVDLVTSFKKYNGAYGKEILRTLAVLSEMDELLHSLSFSCLELKLGKISKNAFLNILLSETQSYCISAGQMRTSSPVKIANIEEGFQGSVDTLLIPQALEGRIPSRPQESPFFIWEGENRPHSLLGDIFLSPAFHLARESFLFHRLIAKTRSRIVLTYPAIDGSGKETVPSSYLDYQGEAEPVTISRPWANVEHSGMFLKHLEEVANIEMERDLDQKTHPAYHGILKDPSVKSWIRKRFTSEPLSPTQIEKYAKCPFCFFAENVLRLKPPEEITPEISPRDQGSIVHAILDRFYRNHLDVFKNAVTDSPSEKRIQPLLNDLVEEVFQEFEKKIDYSAPALRTYEKKSARTMVYKVIMKELEIARALPDPLMPYKCEWVFGNKNQDGFLLDMGRSAPAAIQGRIDRIDVSRDKKRFAVVDYKTGKGAGSIINLIKKGFHVQLPLYVEAARRLLLPRSEPLGGVLLFVKKAEKKYGFLKKAFNDVHFAVSSRIKSILNDDEWDNIHESAIEAAKKHIESIREADFPVRPEKCPHYCDYADVCRYNKKISDQLSETGD